MIVAVTLVALMHVAGISAETEDITATLRYRSFSEPDALGYEGSVNVDLENTTDHDVTLVEFLTVPLVAVEIEEARSDGTTHFRAFRYDVDLEIPQALQASVVLKVGEKISLDLRGGASPFISRRGKMRIRWVYERFEIPGYDWAKDDRFKKRIEASPIEIEL